VSATVIGDGANNKRLQIGTAPNATLLHAKAIGDDGRGSFASLLSSMEWSIKNNADIITMSLGVSGKVDVLIDPVQNARSNGTVVIAAAGNEGSGTSSTPANIYPTIAVGSTNVKPAYPTDSAWRVRTGTVWDPSGGEVVTKDDWGAPPNSWPDQYVVPDITAPGNVIWSADNDIDRVSMCGDVDMGKHLACKKGTSMAAPHVAGVVALMMSNTDRELSPTDVEYLLTNTSTDLNTRKTRQGSGQVNATAAVSAALSTERPPAIIGNTTPTDPDGDGKYEDIDGNGSFGITDVSAFFNSYNNNRIKNNPENFDFNNDGEINIIDVSKLFSECGGCQA
jgi:subtilisin family serine protease